MFPLMERLIQNKKAMLAVIGVLAALIVLLSFLVLAGEEVKVLGQITDVDAGRTLKLSLTDGTTGEEVFVEDRDTIEHFFELLEAIEFTRERGQEIMSGWEFSVDIYRSESRFTRMLVAGNRVQFQEFETGHGGSYRMQRGDYYSIDEEAAGELAAFLEEAMAAELAREEEEEEEEGRETTMVREIYPAIAVVINNHPSSRPSSGLQKADVVYEFLVEGGSTRYLAVYKTRHEENFNIGPIRSLRPYFALQSLEYGGIIAHSGYSARTEQIIRGMGLTQQIGDYSNNFWRDASRRAPHNLYTNIYNLSRAAGDRPSVVEKEVRLLPEENRGPYEEGKTIEIDYILTNRVSYTYDEEKQVYYRYINGEPHTERETGEHYHARRVIIRKTAHQSIPGPEGLVEISLEGSGEGLLYEEGRKYRITWTKEGPRSETVYRYPNDEIVSPIKGTTWIQVTR